MDCLTNSLMDCCWIMHLFGIMWLFRIDVHTWKSTLLSKGLRCGGKAAGDPVYKHQGLFESKPS